MPTEKKDMEIGVHFGALDADYRADSGINQTEIKTAAESCLEQVKYDREHFRVTDAMKLGTLVDCLLLQPELLSERFRFQPDVQRNTKPGKLAYYHWHLDQREEAGVHVGTHRNLLLAAETKALKKEDEQAIKNLLEDHPLPAGVEVMPEASLEQATGMALSLQRNPDYQEMYKRLQGVQVACIAEIDGYRRKALLDMLSEPIICDVKTTVNASPKGFGAEIARWGYYLQGAQYLDVAQALDIPVEEFKIAAVESKQPYLSCVHTLHWSDIAQGRRVIDRILPQLAAANETDRWPGYQPDRYTRIPRWSRDIDNFDQ
jgi:hypothetical protein